MTEKIKVYPEDNEHSIPTRANIVAVSVGNTRAAIATFEQGRIVHVERLTYEDQTGWVANIAQAWERIKSRHAASIVGASVNKNVVDSLSDGVNKLTESEMLWVGNQVARPIPVLTDAPFSPL